MRSSHSSPWYIWHNNVLTAQEGGAPDSGNGMKEVYLEVGQRDGLHEVKAECNSKKVL